MSYILSGRQQMCPEQVVCFSEGRNVVYLGKRGTSEPQSSRESRILEALCPQETSEVHERSPVTPDAVTAMALMTKELCGRLLPRRLAAHPPCAFLTFLRVCGGLHTGQWMFTL